MKTFKLISVSQYRQPKLMFLLAGFCISLLLVRAKLTHSIFFFFLIWNLFLAYTPLALTTLLVSKVQWIEKKLSFYPLFLCWLLLLPNAPYIITDFIHLQKELAVPVWFDVLLLISFTITGLLFGLASMSHMYTILASRNGKRIAHVLMLAVCLLSAYGIYLGRYLRYNSWDVIQRPMAIVNDVLLSLFDTGHYKASLGITLGFGILLYLLFSLYNEREQ